MKVINVVCPTQAPIGAVFRKGCNDSAWTETISYDGTEVATENGITTCALVEILDRFRKSHYGIIMYVETSRTFERSRIYETV